MRIACLGGGPGGLYFALLMKKEDPSHEIVVVERNAPGETFGWGVVFSDETLGYLAENDAPTHERITRTFAHWEAIDIHFKGHSLRSGGHGFSGISRKKLLQLLQARATELGVELRFREEIEPADVAGRFGDYDLVVAADGVNSKIRAAHAAVFRPDLDVRRSKYIWLGTRARFDSFQFIFEENAHGLFQVHGYRFDEDTSTFIVETDERSWRNAGLDRAGTAESIAYLEKLFARHLRGERLLDNKSSWINFVTVRNASWRHGNVVLLGDAAHTAHFSIGSGTKLAMEDGIALRDAFRRTRSVPAALALYEEERRPVVERTQKAAQDSLTWFEHASRYHAALEPLPFAMSLLTRSKKITYDNLALRDPPFVEKVAVDFASRCAEAPAHVAGTPPMFTPFRLRGMRLENRVVVSPMCMYSADDGVVNDFHLVHLGSRALGGAGLVCTEMTDVSADARITPGCAGMYAPEHVAAWRRVVDFVHARSRAKICMQIAHAGRKGSTKRPWEWVPGRYDEPLDVAAGGWPIVAPSPIPYQRYSSVPREMNRADMDRVKADFVRAATMADEAGFDMLELHMAHGYLLSSFLTPLANVRTDAYGGSLENRMRWPLEVFEAVRAAFPEDKPISVRVSATDWVPGGFTCEDAVVLAIALRERGCDIIDVSSGQTAPNARPAFYGRMYQTPFADQIKHEAKIPTMTVGNITSGDQANTILSSERADLIVVARGHLKNPHWTFAAADEQGFADVPWPTPYGLVRPSGPQAAAAAERETLPEARVDPIPGS